VDVGERWERLLAGDELRHELEALIEATQDVEHQGAVLNGFAKSGKGVGRSLHLAAVGVDGERALGQSAELSVEDHGARLAIVEELLLEAEPGSSSGDTIAVVDVVQ
jgi:hypothetical protein